MPFSYPSLLASNAMKSVIVQDDVSDAEAEAPPAHEEGEEAEDENEDGEKEENSPQVPGRAREGRTSGPREDHLV